MNHKIGDTLVEDLTLINCWTSSTEIIIVPEVQDNDRINSFVVNSLSQQKWAIMNINVKIIKSTKSNEKLHKL